MGRKRKTKKKSQINSQGQAFNRFCQALYILLKNLDQEDCFLSLSKDELRTIYYFVIHITRPEAKSGYKISTKELKLVHDSIYNLLHYRNINMLDVKVSPYEYNMLHAFFYVICRYIKSKNRKKYLRSKLTIMIDIDETYKDIRRLYERLFHNSMFTIGNVKNRYFSVDYRNCSISPKKMHLQKIPIVSVYPARSKMLVIHGNHRPIFRLGSPLLKGAFKWLSVPSSLLANHYHGNKIELDLYIQSHALIRLKERLDIVCKQSQNYCLWKNTSQIKSFDFYKSDILLPFYLLKYKVGYLIANVIDDKLVFRTFLFITNSCTPEGDHLKEISGLQKNDIKHWHFDRLSTIVAADVENNPAIHDLFKDIGVDDLLNLKDIVDKPEEMHDKLTGGLIAYIDKGKKEIEELVY